MVAVPKLLKVADRSDSTVHNFIQQTINRSWLVLALTVELILPVKHLGILVLLGLPSAVVLKFLLLRLKDTLLYAVRSTLLGHHPDPLPHH